MKRLLTVLLLGVMLLSVCSCGKASYISDDNAETLEKIVEVTDQYLDLEIDADEANEKLSRLCARLVDRRDEQNHSLDSLSEKRRLSSAELIASYVDSVATFRKTQSEIAEYDQKIITERNEIAEALGMKKK